MSKRRFNEIYSKEFENQTRVTRRATKYFLQHAYIFSQSGKEYKFRNLLWRNSLPIPIIVIAYTIFRQLFMLSISLTNILKYVTYLKYGASFWSSGND